MIVKPLHYSRTDLASPLIAGVVVVVVVVAAAAAAVDDGGDEAAAGELIHALADFPLIDSLETDDGELNCKDLALEMASYPKAYWDFRGEAGHVVSFQQAGAAKFETRVFVDLQVPLLKLLEALHAAPGQQTTCFLQRDVHSCYLRVKVDVLSSVYWEGT